MDNTTQLTIAGVLAPHHPPKPTIPPPPHPPNEFTSLLAEYPQLTQPHNYHDQPAKHDVTHSIVTNGQPVADAWLRNVCTQQRESSSTCWTMASFDHPRVPGLLLSIWCLRNQVTGGPVGTIDASTRPQYPIDTPFPTCTTSPHPARCHHFLEAGPGQSVPPDTGGRSRHPQKSYYHPLWAIRVRQDALWPQERRPDLSKVHG